MTLGTVKRDLETLLNQPSSNVLHSLDTAIKRFRNPLVGPIRTLRIGFQQNLGTTHFLAATLEFLDYSLEMMPFLVVQTHNIFFLHGTHPCSIQGILSLLLTLIFSVDAALVHDIGKIAIPSEILTKPRELNPAEYQLIKTHVERGAEIFAAMDFPWPILEMISQHHERLDGSGYPHGLRAEAIVLEARIIAVADVFDSMASHRPYRYAPGIVKAIEELKTGRSSLYDPYVVDALLKCLDEADESFWRLYPKVSFQHH